jgi:acylphosphatase
MSIVRTRVVFTGDVQGVGFRYTSRRLAERFPITGWVCNHSDGTVELEAQGEPSAVDAFVEELRSEMRKHVSDAVVSGAQPVERESGFSIRR